VNEEDRTPPLVQRFLFVFVATLFAYVTLYGACELKRRKAGPWNVTYALGSNGVPELRIEHPRLLGPKPVTVTFPGEKPDRTDLPITAVFTRPITNAMPFGPVIFVDSTVLPGTVTLNCFGHVVEIVPRTLFLDLKEVAWVPGTNISLMPDTKPAPEKLQTKGQGWRGR
jgi:hypothetical protein